MVDLERDEKGRWLSKKESQERRLKEEVDYISKILSVILNGQRLNQFNISEIRRDLEKNRKILLRIEKKLGETNPHYFSPPLHNISET